MDNNNHTNGHALAVGHASHTGKVRETNEDSYLVLAMPAIAAPVEALFLVADGVGGANAGEVASGMLVEMFWQWFTTGSYVDLVHYNSAHPDYYIAVLKELLEKCNERLHQTSYSDARLEKMGTTATIGLLTADNRLFVGHVGDTRAYRLRQGQLERLTADHSWVADEVAAGRLTEAQAQTHPKRNIVLRVLGNSLLLRVDRNVHEVQPGDLLLLASDGLTGLVTDREITQMASHYPHPQQACEALISLANQRGGADNITVVAARIGRNPRKSDLTNGVAVSSVYLQQIMPAQSNHKSPAVAAAGITEVQQTASARQRKSHRPTRTMRGWVLPFLVVTILSVALGVMTMLIVYRHDLAESVAAFLHLGIDVNGLPAFFAGIIATIAVWLGFLLAFLFAKRLFGAQSENG